MACVIVPITEAIAVTAVNRLTEAKGKKSEENGVVELGQAAKLSIHDKVRWLEKMLWGGSALLTFEHVWHGEIVPFFPFLTGAADASALADMFKEMATAGVGMTALVTGVWGLMLLGARAIENRTMRGLAK